MIANLSVLVLEEFEHTVKRSVVLCEVVGYGLWGGDHISSPDSEGWGGEMVMVIPYLYVCICA